MAVTKIWKIKGKVGSPLTYVANPEKTRREFSESEQQALADVMQDEISKHLCGAVLLYLRLFRLWGCIQT